MRGLVLAFCLLAGCDQIKNAAGPVEKEQAQKTWPREEFRALLMGKTQEQVIRAVGRPGKTTDGVGGDTYWYYNHATVDPITGKTDPHVQVAFTSDGVVRSVRY
jgi:outer membrane protein assembly factor BamE (lipoprotein component of BamABCDE complex)